MCRALAVSPAGYYAWAARPESRRTAAHRRLVTMIRAIHTESRHTYGSPRIHATLQAQGQRIGEHRVAHHGHGTPTTDERRVASYGPRRPVRRHPVPRDACRLRPDGEHESAWELLGQCRGRKLLSYVETRARVSSALHPSGRGQAGYF